MWWSSLGILNQVYFIIACIATGLMIIQTIIALIGIGHDADADMDTSADTDADAGGGDGDVSDGAGGGLRIFSVRTILAFVIMFTWGALAFDTSTPIGPIWSAVIGFALGAGAMVLTAFILKTILKFRSSGTLNMHNAVGKIGEVYIRIGANRSAIGKVNVEFQGKESELSAVTDDGEDLKTGVAVKVTGLLNDSTLIVEKI